MCWKWPTVTFPVTSVITRWPSYLFPRLRSFGLLSAQILSCLGCGRPIASLLVCVIVSHATRENSRPVGRVQLLVDKVKVYEAHDFELETAQLSPRQPYVVEERLPTDVEAECQSETDGLGRRGGSKRCGSSKQQGHCATSPSTPPLSRWSSRRVNSPSAKLPTPPRDHSAPLCSASLCCACCYAHGGCFFFYVHPPFVLTPFWLLCHSPRCFTIPLGWIAS